jgi:magnesium transporter
MIIVHPQPRHSEGAKTPLVDSYLLAPAEEIPPNALWVDLIEPTSADDHKVETQLGIDVPTLCRTGRISLR